MGISYRQYLFPEDSSFKRIPQRIADALPFGRDAIPEYAGITQRVSVAQVIVELTMPSLCTWSTPGHYWRFDEEQAPIKGHLRIGTLNELLIFSRIPQRSSVEFECDVQAKFCSMRCCACVIQSRARAT